MHVKILNSEKGGKTMENYTNPKNPKARLDYIFMNKKWINSAVKM